MVFEKDFLCFSLRSCNLREHVVEYTYEPKEYYMEKQDFLSACTEISSFRIPRFRELPEFELYMDQVIALAEKYLGTLSADGKGLLTPSMINNYVKSGVLPPPTNKRYNRTHLAVLIIICITKPVMEISAISEIIQRGLAANSIEYVLDTLAGTFEGELERAIQDAEKTVRESEAEEILSFIAIENIMKAGAARTVAMQAYHTIKNHEPAEEPKNEKADKKAEKKKAKKEAEASESA